MKIISRDQKALIQSCPIVGQDRNGLVDVQLESHCHRNFLALVYIWHVIIIGRFDRVASVASGNQLKSFRHGYHTQFDQVQLRIWHNLLREQDGCPSGTKLTGFKRSWSHLPAPNLKLRYYMNQALRKTKFLVSSLWAHKYTLDHTRLSLIKDSIHRDWRV